MATRHDQSKAGVFVDVAVSHAVADVPGREPAQLEDERPHGEQGKRAAPARTVARGAIDLEEHGERVYTIPYRMKKKTF